LLSAPGWLAKGHHLLCERRCIEAEKRPDTVPGTGLISRIGLARV